MHEKRLISTWSQWRTSQPHSPFLKGKDGCPSPARLSCEEDHHVHQSIFFSARSQQEMVDRYFEVPIHPPRDSHACQNIRGSPIFHMMVVSVSHITDPLGWARMPWHGCLIYRKEMWQRIPRVNLISSTAINWLNQRSQKGWNKPWQKTRRNLHAWEGVQ